jgi:hypothetical protein
MYSDSERKMYDRMQGVPSTFVSSFPKHILSHTVYISQRKGLWAKFSDVKYVQKKYMYNFSLL